MGMQHARDLCAKLKVPIHKLNYFRDESSYEHYRFPFKRRSLNGVVKKLRRVAGDHVFTVSPNGLGPTERTTTTVLGILFKKPAKVYLFQKLPRIDQPDSLGILTISEGNLPVYFVAPLLFGFFTNFRLHIITEEEYEIIAELHVDLHSIVETTEEAAYN
jgi:hypothetical protein